MDGYISHLHGWLNFCLAIKCRVPKKPPETPWGSDKSGTQPFLLGDHHPKKVGPTESRKKSMYVLYVFFLSFFNFPPPGCVLWKTNNQSCKKKWYVFFPYYPTFFLGCYIVTSFNVLALWPKGPNVRQLYEKLKSIQRLTVRALRLTNQRFV